jgi:hypothetical protein
MTRAGGGTGCPNVHTCPVMTRVSSESEFPYLTEGDNKMVTILIVLVVLMLLGVIPAWPHSRSWGYGPSGGLGLVLLILLILLLTGRL